MTDRLDFAPIAGLEEMMGAKGWLAKRGSFTFTIASHPDSPGSFDISIALSTDYLPKGPFQTFEQAADACNQALHRLGL